MLKKVIVVLSFCFFIFGCGNKSENSVGIINNDEIIDSEDIDSFFKKLRISYENPKI